MAQLQAEQINDITNQYHRNALEEDEKARIMDDTPFDPEYHKDHVKILGMTRVLMQQHRATKNIAFVEESVDNLLTAKGIKADKESFEYKKLCHEFFKAEAHIYDIKQKRERGDYLDEQPPVAAAMPPTVATTMPLAPEPPKGPTIKALVDEWVDESTGADLWKPKSIKKYTGQFTILLQIMGDDTPIDSIDHGTIRDLKKTLQDIPSGMNKKKVFNGKSIDEVISIAKDQGIDTLSTSSINGYIITLGAFFKWCMGQGYMSTNYADGMKIKNNKQKRPDEQRHAFSPDNLTKMFQTPGYLEDTHKKPFQFWLPILGLYTGARINELCQLRIKDIQTIDGILSLVLQEDPSDRTISLKNAASHRAIPLHPFVTDELNFKGYVDHIKAKGETRLFPELLYRNGSYAHQASKWFGTFKKKCGLDDKLLVFHSFRHTLTDNLKQQLINETLIDELTGHALQGETMGRYGKRYSVRVLYDEAVLKLDYGVDLGHLRGSKWVRPGL
ncbi:MAG: tyrosine-type recombinase/integrase [Desulfobacterium sp.]|nr:tyrosine-type recombinase/integrase [Desulfobacterium sp.]